MNLEISNLLDLNRTIARQLFTGKDFPWEVLPEITSAILALGPTLPKAEFEQIAQDIWISTDATIASTACLNGPLIVDHNAEIRHCAYIRGRVIVGKNVIVGNSTELKNCILFDGAQVPHFNYVGDAILGAGAHLGAGAITSNVRSDRQEIAVHADPEIRTGLYKMGAIVGDRAEVGCNSVLNPGTIIGRDAIIYPTACVRGIVPEKHILKANGQIVPRR